MLLESYEAKRKTKFWIKNTNMERKRNNWLQKYSKGLARLSTYSIQRGVYNLHFVFTHTPLWAHSTKYERKKNCIPYMYQHINSEFFNFFLFYSAFCFFLYSIADVINTFLFSCDGKPHRPLIFGSWHGNGPFFSHCCLWPGVLRLLSLVGGGVPSIFSDP